MLTIRQWLKELDLEEYVEVFEAEKVDVESLSYIKEDNLEKLGIPLGPRLKILAAVSTQLEAQATESLAAAPPSLATPETNPPSPILEAEHRQLTVMFCDLVGSTELSTKLDPEEYREMMGSYQTAAGAVAESYDGHVAQYLGDALMVYFGWPHAHEDDAVRAVRAGLEVIEAVKKLDVHAQLSVRIGIATGPVVVGETGGGDPSVPKSAVGETPNLAARVQGMAEPDTVAIGGITRGLIGAAFELEGLGSHSLKGIANPVELYRVLGDKGAESRFEATYADHLTPVVGRNTEVAMQSERWQRAKDGEGQVILLSGEPGIGKSRLIHMLREKLAEETYTPIRYQCSTHHSNSAFYPAIDQLERAAGFKREDSQDIKLDKLEALLEKSKGGVKEVARLFSTLLSLPADRYPTIDATPQQLKEQTLIALNDQLLGLASQNPVMFLIEDVQWCDPTTLELISDAITRIIDARVLMVITYRPEFEAPWTGHAHVSVQTLNRLSRREGSEVVGKLTGGKSLPKEVLDLIVAKTDGIPLYVEELTKNVLESGFLKDVGDHYELDGPLPSLAIPTTLQESLIARLDRLNTVKQVAQIGACIGREFTHELVATVSPLSEVELQASFQQLIKSQIILPRGSATQGSYIFKHALLQDAAYDSLLRGPKRQFHDLIAKGLKAKFPEVVANTPELLAHHFTEADRSSDAIPLWLNAGQNALAGWATSEAVAYLTKGLDLLVTQPPVADRNLLELDFQIALGEAFGRLYGWASKELAIPSQRATELRKGIKDSAKLYPILMRDFVFHLVTGDMVAIRASMRDVRDVAESRDSDGLLALAGFCSVATSFFDGEFLEAQQGVDRMLSVYDESRHFRFAEFVDLDMKVATLLYYSQTLWMLGFPDQALKVCNEMVAIGRRHDLDFQLSWILGWGNCAYQYCGYADEFSERVQESLAIATEHQIASVTSQGDCFKGWAMCKLGQTDAGIETIQRGLKAWKASGAGICAPYFRTFYAQMLGESGRISEALAEIDNAEAQVSRWQERWAEAETLRAKGELLLMADQSNIEQSDECFQNALSIAQSQSAKGWELRAATSLARLWKSQGREQDGHDLLAPIYDWFTEGFDTADLKEAKTLLDELQ